MVSSRYAVKKENLRWLANYSTRTWLSATAVISRLLDSLGGDGYNNMVSGEKAGD
jgi:hypothetical protein